MSGGPNPNLVQTGDLKEGVGVGVRGHYLDAVTPETCPCCHLEHYYERGFGQVLGRKGYEVHICAYADHWLQDELGRVTCPDHKLEKIKDGLFGALPGNFMTPAGLAVYKKPSGGAAAPIVHSQKKRGKR